MICIYMGYPGQLTQQLIHSLSIAGIGIFCQGHLDRDLDREHSLSTARTVISSQGYFVSPFLQSFGNPLAILFAILLQSFSNLLG